MNASELQKLAAAGNFEIEGKKPMAKEACPSLSKKQSDPQIFPHYSLPLADDSEVFSDGDLWMKNMSIVKGGALGKCKPSAPPAHLLWDTRKSGPRPAPSVQETGRVCPRDQSQL